MYIVDVSKRNLGANGFAKHAKLELLKNEAKEEVLYHEELPGGTFMASNLGRFGVDSFVVIANP